VVVFGGSYGIGHSVVEKARELGASVYSFSRSTTGTDVTKYKNVKQALAMVYEHEKRVDAVVLTAGVLRVGSLTNQRRRTIRETVETNLTAAAHVARASFKYLKRSKGKLLLYTSSSYTRGRQDYGVYSATKAGVVNLTQALGEEWMDYGVSINCVNPQRTNTPMRTKAFGVEPEGSLLDADTVAQVSLQVLSSDLTGQVVSVRLDH
jgi:2-C-methyl-D-erythritol 4-phosphate cytidylyltransferase